MNKPAPPVPPRLAEKLLRQCLPKDIRGSAILGDLREEYGELVASGRRRARPWFWLQALSIGLRYLPGKIRSLCPDRISDRRKGEGRMSALITDLRFAWRSLRHSTLFAVLSVGALSVGIGASTAIFTLVHAILIRPLPYPEADRLVSLSEVHPEMEMSLGWASIPNYLDWKSSNTTLEHLGLFRGRSMSISRDDSAEYVYGAFVTADFFSVFGVHPQLGRTFLMEENQPGRDAVVVLSHGLWRRRFGGDPAIVGQDLRVDGHPRRIVGVMPGRFNAPGLWISPGIRMDLWIPFPLEPDSPAMGRSNRSYNVVGRLARGVSLTQAQEDLERVQDSLRQAYPEANQSWDIRLIPWKEMIVGSVRPALALLTGAVALLFLIACANVANLKLNRLLSRQAELSVRMALGAGRARLIRQILSEGLVLCFLATILGAGLAYVALRLAIRLQPGDVPRLAEVHLDFRVLAVGALISLLATLLSGIIPALQASRRNPADGIREQGSRNPGHSRHAARSLIVVVQVALSLALLVAGVLLFRSYRTLNRVEPGFDPDPVLVATIAMSWNRIDRLEDRSRLVTRYLAELKSVPGVESVAMINSLPLTGSNAQMPVRIEGRITRSREEEILFNFRAISPGYFRAMGIPLLAGRDLSRADLAQPGNALVNETAARRFWNGDAIGKRLSLDDSTQWMTVVGVVGDVRHYGLDQEARPEIYQPYTLDYLTSKSFVLKGRDGRLPAVESVRSAFANVDSLQPVREIRSMRKFLEDSLAEPRFQTAMMGIASGLACLLAVVGLVGVIVCTVTERRREIGIRMALGARPRAVVKLVLLAGLRFAGIGIALGIATAALASRVISGFLYSTSALDLPSYLSAATLFLFLVVIASALPVWRATRVDPVSCLKQ